MLTKNLVAALLSLLENKLTKERESSPLVMLKSTLAVLELKNFLKQYAKHESEHTHFLSRLEIFFADRFKEICLSNASGQISPFSRGNLAYLKVAEALKEMRLTNKHVYDLLMPGVNFPAEFYQLLPYEFILVERQGELFPVSIVKFISDRESYKHLEPFSAAELQLIYYHSSEAHEYMQAIVNKESAENIQLAKDKLQSMLKTDKYKITASYGKKGDYELAKSILPLISNREVFTMILSHYIPEHEWQQQVSLIPDNEMINLVLGMNLSNVNEAYSIEVVNQLDMLNEDIKRRAFFLKRLLDHIKLRREALACDCESFPNLMKFMLNFNLADAFHNANYDMNELKKYLHEQIKLLTPAYNLTNEVNKFDNADVLANFLITQFGDLQQIKTIREMSQGDLFLVLMKLNREALESCWTDKQNKFDEFLLNKTHHQIRLELRKNAFYPTNSDVFLIAMYFLILDVYLRQRDYRGNQAYKAIKFTGTEFLKKILLDHGDINELAICFLNDETLKEENIAGIWGALREGVLGRIVESMMTWSKIFKKYAVPSVKIPSEAIVKERMKNMPFSKIVGWEGQVAIIFYRLKPILLKKFINNLSSVQTVTDAKSYLDSYRLQAITSLDDLLSFLIQPHIKSFEIINQLSTSHLFKIMLDLDVNRIKISVDNDAVKLQEKVITQFNQAFDGALQRDIAFKNTLAFYAYIFCLAQAYKKYRLKGAEYISIGAQAASFFKRGCSKTEKISFCEKLQAFLLFLMKTESGKSFTKEEFINFLRANFRDSWQKDIEMLEPSSDMLNRLIQKAFEINSLINNELPGLIRTIKLEEDNPCMGGMKIATL